MSNVTPACNTDSILKDAIVKFLMTADDDDLREIFMEVACGGVIQDVKDIVDEIHEGYLELREEGDL